MYTAAEIAALEAAGRIEAFYNGKAWRKLSKRVIAENHGECYLCNQGHRLSRATLVHHVRPLRQHPELAYSRTYTDESGEHMQLMPLCHECHERVHERGIYTRPRGFLNEEKW